MRRNRVERLGGQWQAKFSQVNEQRIGDQRTLRAERIAARIEAAAAVELDRAALAVDLVGTAGLTDRVEEVALVREPVDDEWGVGAEIGLVSVAG